MKTAFRESYPKLKMLIKKIPGEQTLSKWIHNIIQVHELSTLIKDGKFVILHPFLSAGDNDGLTGEIAHEISKDLLGVYGSVRLGKKMAALVKPAQDTLLFNPLALVSLPSSHDDYLAQVGPKTRNMLRKSEREGYDFREFEWNDYLEDIYEINTSKEIRQAEPMRGWYREPVQPRHLSAEESQYRKYYGAFKDGKLYAYLHIVLCGDFAFFRHFLGHAEHLKYGIMNGLISHAVREYSNNPQIRWLKYGSFQKSSLGSFRKHAGFQGYAVFLDLAGDQELLDYSKGSCRTIWHV